MKKKAENLTEELIDILEKNARAMTSLELFQWKAETCRQEFFEQVNSAYDVLEQECNGLTRDCYDHGYHDGRVEMCRELLGLLQSQGLG